MLKSIRSRLTTAFILLAIGPLLVVGAIISVTSFWALKEQAVAYRQGQARRVSMAVESFVHELEKNLEMVFLGRDFMTLDPQEQEQTLAELLSFENRFQELTLVGKDGKELLRQDRDQVVTQNSLRNRASDPAFQRAMTSGVNYFGPVQFAPRTGEPLMIIAIPWSAPLTGNIEYVLFGLIRLKKVWGLLADLSLDDETVFIVDAQGSIVGHPDPSITLSGRRFSLPSPTAGIAEGLDAGPVILAAERLVLGDQTLYVVAQQAKATALKLARRVVAITLLVVLVSLATAIAISILTIGSIVKPLQRLAIVARSIQQGDLNQQMEYGRADEVGELALAFNAMTARLRLSIVDLKKEIKEREHEIEERTKAEAALRENRATLRQILDTVPQAIFWKDVESVYLGCNRVLASAVGLEDPEQIKGKTDFDLPWPNDEAEAYRADDREVIDGKQTKRHIIEPLQLADGSRRWIDTTKVPLLDGEGKIIGVLGAYEDITERKRAEKEQAELEIRLRQSQKMEAIGTLAGGIAHDFNNILTIILGYNELALAEEAPDRRAQDLEQVRLGAERARGLVQQILAFSRRTEQERQPLQVAVVVKEALKMLRSSIPTTIEIKQEIHSSGTVLADPTQIHQIIMNLCTNAYHAMRETGGTLAVSLHEVEIHQEEESYGELTPGQYLNLTVSDTGYGISPNIKDKIFEPYFTTKDTGEGTGLGLAVVHGIVKSHHGHITVFSEPGQGTTFQIYLPLVEKLAVELSSKESLDDLAGKGEHILFVDDEAQIRAYADQIFALNNYQVTSCANAVRALAEFQERPDQFDLVITDMTMPYMTGAELTQKILGIRPDIPIILCTGQNELINKEKALAMGVYDYLAKPVMTQDFLAACRKALTRRSPQALAEPISIMSQIPQGVE